MLTSGVVWLTLLADIKRDIDGPTGFEIPSDRIHFDAVVVGAGQAGLCILGRLKAGGVHNCIALETYDSIGGNWQDRYDSVKREVAHVLLCETQC